MVAVRLQLGSQRPRKAALPAQPSWLYGRLCSGSSRVESSPTREKKVESLRVGELTRVELELSRSEYQSLTLASLAHSATRQSALGLSEISRLRRAYPRQLCAKQSQCAAAVASRAVAWARRRASASEVRGGGHSSSLECFLPAHAPRHPPRKRLRAAPMRLTTDRADRPRGRTDSTARRGKGGKACSLNHSSASARARGCSSRAALAPGRAQSKDGARASGTCPFEQASPCCGTAGAAWAFKLEWQAQRLPAPARPRRAAQVRLVSCTHRR